MADRFRCSSSPPSPPSPCYRTSLFGFFPLKSDMNFTKYRDFHRYIMLCMTESRNWPKDSSRPPLRRNSKERPLRSVCFQLLSLSYNIVHLNLKLGPHPPSRCHHG